MQYPDTQPLTYDVAGPPQAFPIVLVHGAAWSRKMWAPQIEALSDEFRVLAVDLPGHGVLQSERFQLASAAQIVIECLKQETRERALIVGLSLGGYVAIKCAHMYKQATAGLLVSGCCLEYRGVVGFLSRLDSSIVTSLFSEDRLSRIQEKSLRTQFAHDKIESQLKAGFSWKVLPQVYRELAAYDFPTLLHSYPGPILIVNGENDRQNRQGENKFLQSVQDGQLHIIPQAGHICNLEQPEAFTQIIRTFARRLSQSPQR